ncbi:hypothetical protein [Microbulbifer variabilis]|uniref:hypothetical protein n=1 Tax=Microbulbifer variabilis TaxID=266805 RepID=UPI001CFC9BFA|nr:hypothetical protein [Microbulbifer variabilis]
MKKIALLIALAIYLLGYVEIRNGDILVHATSYKSEVSEVESGKQIYQHSVRRGDFVGSLQPFAAGMGQVAVWVYALLRYIELIYWHISEPVGAEWPYER